MDNQDKKEKWCKTEACKYAIYGAFFGLLFPTIAMSIDFIRLNLEFTWNNVMQIQSNNPIHLIINTAPLFLGLFASFAGKRQDQLIKKNTQLIKTAQFKEHFLANMSHEIRTPMNGIIGMIDVLEKSAGLSQKQNEYIDLIQQSSHDLLSILNDILDLSKLESKKMELTSQVIRIHEHLNSLKGLFAAKAKQKGLELNVEIDHTVPECIKTDKIKLSQILSNLLGNAVKFTANGQVTIKVKLEEDTNTNKVLLFNVMDTGEGILKKQQEKLFTPFYQLEKTATKPIKGTGLGLSICKEIVLLMGGQLGVNSQIKGGSDFWFSIPFNSIGEDEVLPQQEKEIHSEEVSNHFNLKILLVDDNKMNLTIGKTMLTMLGCTVDLAHDGQEAVSLFQEHTYDLILMDIQMPVMDGVEATQRIKADVKQNPPIIALSANAMEGDADKFIQQGLDDYLHKPVTLKTLKNKLNVWFELKIKS